MSHHNLTIKSEFAEKIKVKVKTKINGNVNEKDLEPGAKDVFEVDDKQEVTITIKMDIKSGSTNVQRGEGIVPPFVIVSGQE